MAPDTMNERGAPDHEPRSRGTSEPRRSDSRRNKDRLLETALRVLSEDPEASVEEIAAEAELTRSTVYRHFGGRDGLLLAIGDRITAETQDVFRGAVAQEPDFAPCAALMIRDALRNAFARRRIWLYLRHLGRIPELGAYRPQSAFVEWLEAGQKAGAFRDDVPVGWLVSAWMHIVMAGIATVERDGIDLDRAADLAADAALQVLTGGPSQLRSPTGRAKRRGPAKGRDRTTPGGSPGPDG